MLSRLYDRLSEPKALRRFHAVMTLLWLVLIPVSALTGLAQSVAWVVLMSAWANFAAHFASWQSARVETRQEKQDKN